MSRYLEGSCSLKKVTEGGWTVERAYDCVNEFFDGRPTDVTIEGKFYYLEEMKGLSMQSVVAQVMDESTRLYKLKPRFNMLGKMDTSGVADNPNDGIYAREKGGAPAYAVVDGQFYSIIAPA